MIFLDKICVHFCAPKEMGWELVSVFSRKIYCLGFESCQTMKKWNFFPSLSENLCHPVLGEYDLFW